MPDTTGLPPASPLEHLLAEADVAVALALEIYGGPHHLSQEQATAQCVGQRQVRVLQERAQARLDAAGMRLTTDLERGHLRPMTIKDLSEED